MNRYFNRTGTLENLKAEYRRLAMENHPDRGGNTETMQTINFEFDLVFRILEKKLPVKKTAAENETGASYRRDFYTQNGWAGSRYNPNISLRDVANILRDYVKDVYPTWKFSVRTSYYSGGCALSVALMEAPARIFVAERIVKAASKAAWERRYRSYEEAYERLTNETEEGKIQNWEFWYDCMTDVAKTVLDDVRALVYSYRYDDSDSQIDYFSTNFYANFNIGKWDKPLKIVPKTERIQTAKTTKKTKRIAA